MPCCLWRCRWPQAWHCACGCCEELFEVNGDSLIYGGLAKNLLLHGRYALTLPGGRVVSDADPAARAIRCFSPLCFRLFGMENYYAAACVQIALDLLGCLLLAGFVRRIAPAPVSRGAALATLWLAALCPFTASYAAAPLTETPTLFVLALAMWAMARFRDEPSWANALWFTFAVTCATLLRPDGALAAVAFAPATGSTRARCDCGAGAGDGIPLRKLLAHGGGLRVAGAGSLCRVDGAQLARLSRL